MTLYKSSVLQQQLQLLLLQWSENRNANMAHTHIHSWNYLHSHESNKNEKKGVKCGQLHLLNAIQTCSFGSNNDFQSRAP